MLMKRTIVVLACSSFAALMAPLVALPPAGAATRAPIDFTDHRVGLDTSAVTTNLPECPTAVAVDLRAHVQLTPAHGVFVAVRDIQCGSGTGFVIRLTATFAEDGSSGSWSIVDSYGALAGMRGAGKITGTPFGGETEDPADDGIDDHYTGWVTRR
jgi:hypothetical protein